jgi:2,3-dihydroxy-p-cumate/2,3-dihydroxybenzoate 3,4-dioxygenase
VIEHLVAFRFRPEVHGAARAQLIDALRALPARFHQMIEFRIGVNVSDRDDRFTHAFTVRFGSLEDLNDYLHSEAHERFVAEEFRPVIAERAIVSFEY